MANINQLIAPVTSLNTVNSIFISSIPHVPSILQSKPKKGKQYSTSYVKVKHDFGSLRMKEFISNFLNNKNSLVSKATPIKDTVSYNFKADIEKLEFINNASKEDLKKVKPEDYFGKRVVDGFIYDFDRRVIHRIESKSENGMYFYDRLESQPMINMNDYKGIFINKKYLPILDSNLMDTSETTLFEEHQQKGVEPEILKQTASIFLDKHHPKKEEEEIAMQSRSEAVENETEEPQSKYKIITRVPRASTIQRLLDKLGDPHEAEVELIKRCIKIIKDYEGLQAAKSAEIYDDFNTIIERADQYRKYNQGAFMYIDALMEFIQDYYFNEQPQS